MDEQIASNICVWREPEHFQAGEEENLFEKGVRDNRRVRFRHRKGKRS